MRFEDCQFDGGDVPPCFCEEVLTKKSRAANDPLQTMYCARAYELLTEPQDIAIQPLLQEDVHDSHHQAHESSKGVFFKDPLPISSSKRISENRLSRLSDVDIDCSDSYWEWLSGPRDYLEPEEIRALNFIHHQEQIVLEEKCTKLCDERNPWTSIY